MSTRLFDFISTLRIFVLGILFVSPSAHSASSTLRTPGGGSVIINAKEASRDYDRKVIELKGDVQLVYDQQYISCDQAVIYLDKQEIEAEGHLVISSPQAYIEGDRAVVSYKDKTGVIINGFVKSGQVLLEGQVVRKLGENQYEAEKAYYTACTTCPTAWSFRGEKIRAQMGGYAHIKQPILEVGSLPVFWLPYLIVPLKSERQTGLLIPSLDFSGSGGAAITMRYFWAISRSQDATFGLKTYTLRGWKTLGNYRYMLNETSGGELNSGYFPGKDRRFKADPYFVENGIDPAARRWFLTYDHLYEMPSNFVQRTKLNFVSDLRYPQDFPDDISGVGDPALENRLSLTRNTETTHASIDTSYYINQLKANPLASNRDAVHRFPEIRYALAERSVGDSNLLFNFNADYVNFAREDFAYDDVYTNDKGVIDVDTNRSQPGAGSFDPSIDVIRAGQRLDLQPELSYPIHAGRFIDILPTAQFRHTQYSFNVTPPDGAVANPTPYRQYLRGSISARTRFFRVYGQQPEASPPLPPPQNWVDRESQSPPGSGIATITAPRRPNLYRHEVVPEVVLNDVPYLRQEEHPFFGKATRIPVFKDRQPIGDEDFRSDQRIQFDYNDRVTNRNTVSFILNNFLVRKSFSSPTTPVYKQIVNLRLMQSYDLDEAQRSGDGPTFPWSDISALLDVRLDNFETNTLLNYFPYHNVVNTSARARVKNSRGDFLQVSVTQAYTITENVADASKPPSENFGLAAGFDSKYLTFSGQIETTPEDWRLAQFKPKSWSTNFNIKPPGDCWGIRTSVSQELATGELLWKIDFDYKFGGSAI